MPGSEMHRTDDLPEAPRSAVSLHVHCPHCQNEISVVGGRLEDIHCTACGSTFRLEQEQTRTFVDQHRRLGKFQVLERIGAGSFGVVWKALDTELGRLVALKIPHAGHVGSQQDAERFLREARSAGQLRHPGIVTVHEVGHYDAMPYLVCDFIEGVTLADLLTTRRLGFREAAMLLAEVAEALHYAHSMGVVHRDIKPSNIILDRSSIVALRRDAPANDSCSPLGDHSRTPAVMTQVDDTLERVGKPMLMDFGLALRDEAEVTMTIDGQVLGTPAYMSPEQAAGLGHNVDGRSDVYSVGVVFYRLCTGELPFRGNSRMLMDQVLREEPRPPRRLNDKIPRELETITLKCMAKQPDQRYTTAGDLAGDLHRWLRGEPIHAQPPGMARRLWLWCHRPERIRDAGAFSIFLAIVLTIWALIGIVEIHFGILRVAKPRAAVLQLLGLIIGLYLPMAWVGLGCMSKSLPAFWAGVVISLSVLCFMAACLSEYDTFLRIVDVGELYRNPEVRYPVFSLMAVLASVQFVGYGVALLAYHSHKNRIG